jgi:protein-tyrosine phosphatase
MIEVQETSPGDYQIDWETEFKQRPVSVYSDLTPKFPGGLLLGEGQIKNGRYAGLPTQRRHYFHIEDQQGLRRLAAQRNIPLSGAVNFRDLGGYLTNGGQVTKWGTLFRSGHMSRLTSEDQTYLAQLDIRTVCDFRREIEIQSEASLLPGSPTTHNVQITPGARDANHIQQLFAGTDKPEDVVAAMLEIMRILITDAAPQYKKLFELLLEHDDGTFLMNCSAGKERTGVGVALLLMALGVPRETIQYDFMLSGKYYPIESEIPRVFEKYEVGLRGEAGRRLVMPLLEARQAYIQVVFDEIDKNFASDEAFIRDTFMLGDVELSHLRAKFTDQA